jgi:hypothetical protein
MKPASIITTLIGGDMINTIINQDEIKCKQTAQTGTSNVKFSMNIPRQLHEQFRKKSFLAGLDMKDVLIEAINNYVRT